LLVEIDKPKSPKKKPKHQEEIKDTIIIGGIDRPAKQFSNHFAHQLENYKNQR